MKDLDWIKIRVLKNDNKSLRKALEYLKTNSKTGVDRFIYEPIIEAMKNQIYKNEREICLTEEGVRSMKIYNVERKEAYDPDTEPSKIDDDDLQYLDKKDYEYIICSYAQDMWSGEGAAVLKDRNGKFMFIELGHCSCYGPLEERNPKCIYSLEEIIKLLDKHCKDTYGGYAKAVAEKFKELEEKRESIQNEG